MTSSDPLFNARRHVRHFTYGRGPRLLELLGEKPRDGDEWHTHSHGAFITVEGPNDDVFDRIVVILPSQKHQSAERFREWATQRIKLLGAYMEACDTGRVVRIVTVDACVAAVLMGRAGYEPGGPGGDWPPAGELPALLARFAIDVERYVRTMGDDQLAYVGAVHMHRAPRRNEDPKPILGLDVLNSAIGLVGPPMTLAPAALLRGIIVECTEHLQDSATSWSGLRHLAQLHAKQQVDDLVRRLDDLVADLDTRSLSVSAIARRLRSIQLLRWTPIRRLAWATSLIMVGISVLLVAIRWGAWW